MSTDCIRCSLCVLDCPTFTWSGDETRTMRGRRLALDAGVPARELANGMAGCIACGLCDTACPKDLNNSELVLSLMRESPRTDADQMSESIERTGNPFGVPEPPIRARDDGPILLWMGCTLRARTPRLVASVLAAIDRIGLNVSILEDEACCGWPLLRSGDEAGARRLLDRLAERLDGISSIVTPCAPCFDHLKSRLSAIGIERPVRHLVSVLEEAGVTPQPREGDLVQWPSHLLNRHSSEFQPLAARLAARPGCVDGLNSFRYTQNLGEDFPEPHEGIARARLAALTRGPMAARRIITLCPTTQSLLDRHPELPSAFLTECLDDGHGA